MTTLTSTHALPLSPRAKAPVSAPDYVLALSCPDRRGIAYALSEFLVERGCNIVESQQFDDRETGSLFMRVHFEGSGAEGYELEQLRREFAAVATRFSMSWRLADAGQRQRVLIMVSKFGHCLNDLLFRVSSDSLNVEVVAVVSNHPDLGWLADSYDVPFHHIPVTPPKKGEAEAQLLELVDELKVDLVVLARYMQILSPELCQRLEGRAINIHHSLLPSFKGARPYEQAYSRGVKLVGATAHYVTPNLDEGPIIEQAVARVDHTLTTEQITAVGRDNECLALSHAVRWHTEHRVMLDGTRTIVFA